MARMPLALVAALIAALILAAPASAAVRSVPAGWGHGSHDGWDGWGDGDADDGGDEDTPADEYEPAEDQPTDDGPEGWIPGDGLTPGGGDEPGAELLPPAGARQTVPGRKAALGSNGLAYAPSKAPRAVKNAVWAANQLRRKPYKWGGGHGSWRDSGYDCSGSVSYVLHAAGVLNGPMTSGGFMRYGKSGLGKWITLYANKGHVFMVIAGLRFDTSPLGAGERGPRWRAFGRRDGGFKKRHPAGF
jgi:hypothetical protein